MSHVTKISSHHRAPEWKSNQIKADSILFQWFQMLMYDFMRIQAIEAAKMSVEENSTQKTICPTFEVTISCKSLKLWWLKSHQIEFQ